MAKSTEQLIVKKIEGGLRGLRMGTKTIEQARVQYFLNKLLEVNDGLYEHYYAMYVQTKKKFNA